MVIDIAAAAAAKSLQSCPTLCDLIDGSPPGSPVPGNLQARTLEWVAIAILKLGFPCGTVVKQPSANTGAVGDAGSIPGMERSPGVGNGNLLQYSCLENYMDRGVWRVTIHGVTKSQTWLSTCTHIKSIMKHME